jgi:ankyrin repeat protein
MATALQHYVNYDSIPLSKRIEKHLLSDQRNPNSQIKGRDINWRSGINTVDPETGLTPLMVAIIQGKKDIVVALIERGAEIEATDARKGRTCLQIAAKEGQHQILLELLKRDAVVNSSDNHQKTPLMHAAKGGYLDCASALINYGAGVNMIDDCGYTSLHYASKFGHHEIITVLIQAAAAVEPRDNNEGFSAIHFAAQYGRKETVLTLLSYGARINRRSIKEKITPLMLAAREGNKTIVSLLISKGAEVNAVDIHGWTSLHFACSWGRRDTAHILIVDGQANVNARDSTRDGTGGTTPLIVACKGAQVTIAKLLLNYGADINLPELYLGQNPLSSAAEYGHANVIQVLLEYSADINYQNHFTGSTALMTAVAKGQRSAIITLLNNYADMNIIDYKFLNVFDYSDQHRTRDYLISALIHISPGAKVNIIPWLEMTVPFLNKYSTYGGPNSFLNHFLYNGEKGLFYGLYNQTRDHDVYLIYCLIILLSTCQKSILSHPKEKSELELKIKDITEMLEQCFLSQGVSAEENTFIDCFLLGSLPIKELLSLEDSSNTKKIIEIFYVNYYKYFLNAFFFGPLSLYLENKFTSLLKLKTLSDKIDESFQTTIKSPTFLYSGYGSKSSFLLFRYNCWKMFLLEGLSRLLWIFGICWYSFYYYPNSNYFNRGSFNLLTADPHASALSFNSIETFLVVMAVSNAFYEIGQLEEKRWMLSPSVIFDFSMLEKVRYQKLYSHFFETPWKIMDFIITLISLSWVGVKFYFTLALELPADLVEINYYQSVSGELLMILLIVLMLNFLQYATFPFEDLYVEILTIFKIFKDIAIYFILFSFMILGFGVFYFTLYHNELDSFSSFPKTIQTLFNAILLNYDSSLFDSSNNSLVGILISVVFLIMTIFIFFNGIIGNISSNYANNKILCKEWMIQIKCHTIQKFSPVLEKSPLAMLPPLFNCFNIFLYGPHTYYIWRARLALDEVKCISIAGTMSDYLMGLLLLIPSAVYEYVVIDMMNEKNGFLWTCLYAPLGIFYVIYCLLDKLVHEPWVRVILKSRLSDGRLRVSYSIEQDLVEENALSQFEDQRIFKDLQKYYAVVRSNEKRRVNDYISSGLKHNHEEIDNLQNLMKEDEKDAEFQQSQKIKKRLTSDTVVSPLGQQGVEEAGEDENKNSVFQIIWKKIFQKRSNDYVGRNTRISPYNPFLQLNNLQDPLPEVLPSILQAKPKSIYQNELIQQKIMEDKIAYKKKYVLLANDIHSEYQASIIPNASSDLQSILQENPERPSLLWVEKGNDHKKTINPYQPGMSHTDQWDELAQEKEVRGQSVSFLQNQIKNSGKKKQTATLISPWTDNDDNDGGGGGGNPDEDDEVPPEHRMISPQASLIEGSMFNTADKNNLFLAPQPSSPNNNGNNAKKIPNNSSNYRNPSAADSLLKNNNNNNNSNTIGGGGKIIQTDKFIHHSEDKYLIDEQAVDHFKQLNNRSLYFQLNVFPPIYHENERKVIFQKVLKNLFLDDFAYQIEKNEKYFYELKKKINSLESLNKQQNQLIGRLLDRLDKQQSQIPPIQMPVSQEFASNQFNESFNDNNYNVVNNNSGNYYEGNHQNEHFVFHEYDNPNHQTNSYDPNFYQGRG